MNSIIKNSFSMVVIAATLLMVVFTTPIFSQAQSVIDNKNAACQGLPGGCDDRPASDTAFNGLWENILNVVSFIVGAVAVLMIIIGGFRYVLSQGDPQATQNAKNTILYALIGLVVAFIARGLVVFVINRV